MVPEAELKKTEFGLVAQGEGWFVVNARDVSWIRSEERGRDTDFEGRQAVNDVAARHGASVLEETSSSDEAYASFGPEERSAYREGWLPS